MDASSLRGVPVQPPSKETRERARKWLLAKLNLRDGWFSHTPFENLLCTDPPLVLECIKLGPKEVVDTFMGLSDEAKACIANKFAPVLLSSLLKYNSNEPVLRCLIELVLALPPTFGDRIKNLFVGQRPDESQWAGLRRRVVSGLVDGFSCLSSTHVRMFFRDRPEDFVALFDTCNNSLTALAAIMLAAAPNDVRDDLFVHYSRQLLKNINQATLIGGLVATVTHFFGGDAPGYALTCVTGIETMELTLGMIGRLGEQGQRAVLAEAFNELVLMIVASVAARKPSDVVRWVCDFIGQIRFDRISCDPFVCARFVGSMGDGMSPLGDLLGMSQAKGKPECSVSRAILPYTVSLVSQAPVDVLQAFALERSATFFMAFDLDNSEFPICFAAILNTISDDRRSAFANDNADAFLRSVLFSPLPSVREVGLNFLRNGLDSFLVQHGAEVARILVERADVREFGLELLSGFRGSFVAQNGKEVIETFVGSGNPILVKFVFDCINGFNGVQQQHFFISYGDSFLTWMGCIGKQDVSSIERMLGVAWRARNAGAITSSSAEGLLYCCLSGDKGVRDFGLSLFRSYAPNIRAKAIVSGLMGMLVSVLGDGLLEELRALNNDAGASLVNVAWQAMVGFLFDEVDKVGSKYGMTLPGRLNFRCDWRDLCAELWALKSTPNVQCAIFRENESIQLLFALCAAGAFVDQVRRGSRETFTMIISLVCAQLGEARVFVVALLASCVGYEADNVSRQQMTALGFLSALLGDDALRCLPCVCNAIRDDWNDMLCDVPEELRDYLMITEPQRP
ncbi:MAG: hypothetical protein LBD72_02605 [Puniceicoccales bacterium]|nr:hypothetical protein [Puniceicoccales bacterium]